MKTIDIHAHLIPQAFWRAAAAGRDWYSIRFEPDEGQGAIIANGKRSRINSPPPVDLTRNRRAS